MEKVTTSLNYAVGSTVGKVASMIERARTALTEATERGIESVTGTAAIAQDKLTEAASEAIDRVDAAATQAVGTVTETAERAQASLEETVETVGRLGDAVVRALPEAMATSVQNWLEAHPIVAWSLAHPLASLGILLLLLLLSWGLLGELARLIRRGWSFVFQSLFQLIQTLLVKVSPRFKRLATANYGRKSNKINRTERMRYILSRLEAIRQEQTELLVEMNLLLDLEQS